MELVVFFFEEILQLKNDAFLYLPSLSPLFCFLLVVTWDLCSWPLALRRARASPWTGWDVILSLAWRKLTLTEQQLWART